MRRMLRIFTAALVFIAGLALASPRLLLAQNNAPHVVFVEEPQELAMSSVTDPGPDGATRLADIFRAEGAVVSWTRLRDTIPEDVDVIVLVRPRRALSSENLARVWLRVAAGASLLVAVDPSGFQGGSTEQERGGLSTLTTQDEGLTLLDGIALEPWYTNDTLRELRSTLLLAQPDTVPNPITDPLKQYDLPILLWGARPVRAEAFGVDSAAWSLAIAQPEYVETSASIFPRGDNPGDPFELDIGKDRQGLISVAGIGENTKSGSRVAVLGDAEMVQNAYGLAVNGSGQPLFPGNMLLTQRIAAWLLRHDDYPALPGGLLWIAIDGQDGDWAQVPAAHTADAQGDSSILSLDITDIRGIRSDSYAYLAIQTAQNALPGSQVTVEFDLNRDGQSETTITLDGTGVSVQNGANAPEAVYDAAFAEGHVLEVRIPLRLVNPVTAISGVCLNAGNSMAFPPPPDCVEAPILMPLAFGADPAPLRIPVNTPLASVTTDGVNNANVRSAPSASANVVGTLPLDSIAALIGRTADSTWFYTQTASAAGWVNAVSLTFVGNTDRIPVRSG